MFYFIHDELVKTRDAFLASTDVTQDNLDLAVVRHCVDAYQATNTGVGKVITFSIHVHNEDVNEDDVRADLIQHVNKFTTTGGGRERTILFAITHQHGSVFMTRDGSGVNFTSIYVRDMMLAFAKRWQGRATVRYLLSKPIECLA